jgi:ParB family transcriptional regulator, chromosome partitioning protein
MAKRKRLTPARSDFLKSEDQAEPNQGETVSNELEHKSMFPMGVAKTSPRPPIAQVAGEAAITAALSEMTDMVARARSEGRIVEALPLSEIEMGHLVRDRIHLQSEDMEALKSSLKLRGQQTAIEVVDRGGEVSPRYGLISGWRRMMALSEIEAPEVLAIVRQPKTSSDAYVAMIEENEIRSDISFYERARIVVKALEQGVYSDPKEALQTLFANVSRAKRSKIKSFMVLVDALDGDLRFPSAISERMGLELVKRLQENPQVLPAIKSRLAHDLPSKPEAEMAILLAESSRLNTTSKPRLPKSPSLPVQVSFDATQGRAELSGAGVDAAFVRDLQAWIKARLSRS